MKFSATPGHVLPTAIRAARLPILIAVLVLLAACGDPAGTPCEITGSGFHAKDPCRHQCLSRWSLNCPDGNRVTPNVCTGTFECAPGSCPDGQVCYHDDDPFDDRSFCVPQAVCGDLSQDALSQWEANTVERQNAIIRERLEKQARRANATAIAADVDAPGPSTKPPAATAEAAPLNAAQSDAGSAPDQAATGAATNTATTAAQIASSPPLPCAASPEREAVLIQNQDSERGGAIKLSGGDTFKRSVRYDWQFALTPTTHGFRLQLFDRPQRAIAIDLAAVTPPFRGPANPRDIFGWHFRNAANTAPNTGDVNAPQHLRLFQFAPSLTGASGNIDLAARSSQATGRGWLRIEELTLTPPQAGARASVEKMAFRACLSWPRPSDEDVQRWQTLRDASAAAAYAADLNYDATDREMFGACGLDLAAYELKALVGPRVLSLDIDGDGAHDQVAQATRIRDGQRGIALCRAGTWLTWVGEGHLLARSEAVASTVASLEAWRIDEADRGPFGYVDEPPWPNPDGQVLVLERIEKSLVALYWRDGALRAHKAYRFVEP